MKKITIILVLVISNLLQSGCKPDELKPQNIQSNSYMSCKVIKDKYSAYSYNSDGKITNMYSLDSLGNYDNNYNEQFVYLDANKVCYNTYHNGSRNTTDTLILNSDGYLSSIKSGYGSDHLPTIYSYNSSGNLIKILRNNSNVNEFTQTDYTWVDGNCTQIHCFDFINGGGQTEKYTDTYTYNNIIDKTNYPFIGGTNFGFLTGKKSKNYAIKIFSTTPPSTVGSTDYSWSYNADNIPTSCNYSSSGGSKGVVFFEFNCK